jgi:hypothetical protein
MSALSTSRSAVTRGHPDLRMVAVPGPRGPSRPLPRTTDQPLQVSMSRFRRISAEPDVEAKRGHVRAGVHRSDTGLPTDGV